MKKKGIFDKAKKGVVENISTLAKNIKQEKDEENFGEWDGPMVRLACHVPRSLRQEYKSLMAKSSHTIQQDLVGHILKVCARNKQ